MSTPNPLAPEGSLGQQSKGKSNVRIAFFTIAAIHVVLLGGLLNQGCKEKPKAPAEGTVTNAADSGFAPYQAPASNAAPATVATTSAPPALPTDTNPIPTAPATVTPPATVTTPPPATTEGVQEHVVAKNESFSTIAKKYHVTVKAIEAANPGVVSTKLKLGQKLQIPAVSSSAATTTTSDATGGSSTGSTELYTIKAGDRLEKIAKAHGTTVKELMALNNLKTANSIQAGHKLKIPSKGASTSSTPVETPAPAATGTNGGR